MDITDADIERFMVKVDKQEGDDPCWIWTAVRNPDGYGNFKLNGTMVKAHRVSYEIFNGPIPIGHEVMHSCDRPECVAPRHLSTGTHLDNMRDREAKGRGHDKAGEANGRAKLTLAEVWQIRDLMKCKLFTGREVGKLYNISNVVVSKIHLKQLWKSGANPYERTAS